MAAIDRIELARQGNNPTVIKRMKSGWAVLGDWQFLRGYSLLLADPIVESLNEATPYISERFCQDMIALGGAIMKATGASRINYEILGNNDKVLHAHLWPRFETEEYGQIEMPVYLYAEQELYSEPFELEKHGELINKIRSEL